MYKIIFSLLGLLLLTSACGGSHDTKSTEPTPEVTPAVKEIPSDVFLQEMHREFPDDRALGDADLVDLAKGACEMLTDGETVESVFFLVNSAAAPKARDLALEATSEGIMTFCPKFSDDLLAAASAQ